MCLQRARLPPPELGLNRSTVYSGCGSGLSRFAAHSCNPVRLVARKYHGSFRVWGVKLSFGGMIRRYVSNSPHENNYVYIKLYLYNKLTNIRNICRIYLRYVRMHFEYTRTLYHVYENYILNVYNIYFRYTCCIFKIYSRYIYNISFIYISPLRVIQETYF